jgi:hypothetical protein
MWCATAGDLDAQLSPLRLGVDAGVAIATLVGSDADDVVPRSAPYVGASLLFHRGGSAVGFQTGVLYVPKGATVLFAGGTAALETTYIEIPLMLRLGLPSEDSGVMPVLVAGASVGLKSGCQLTARSGNVSLEFDCDDSFLPGQFDLKAVDFGLTVGADLEIPAGRRLRVVPSVRYTRGTSVIGDTATNGDATNSSFQIGAGVRLRL